MAIFRCVWVARVKQGEPVMAIDVQTPRQSAVAARREELLTVKEYAFVIGQHPKSVYRRIAKGLQRGVLRFGLEIRIDLSLAGRGAPFERYTRKPAHM